MEGGSSSKIIGRTRLLERVEEREKEQTDGDEISYDTQKNGRDAGNRRDIM